LPLLVFGRMPPIDIQNECVLAALEKGYQAHSTVGQVRHRPCVLVQVCCPCQFDDIEAPCCRAISKGLSDSFLYLLAVIGEDRKAEVQEIREGKGA
jgi:hypothetical protein